MFATACPPDSAYAFVNPDSAPLSDQHVDFDGYNENENLSDLSLTLFFLVLE
jgi:hypothetical protein